MPVSTGREESTVSDAPHPWTYHDPGDTDAEPRITDDNDQEVTLARAWREVQILRGCLSRIERAAGFGALREVAERQAFALGCSQVEAEERLRDLRVRTIAEEIVLYRALVDDAG